MNLKQRGKRSATVEVKAEELETKRFKSSSPEPLHSIHPNHGPSSLQIPNQQIPKLQNLQLLNPQLPGPHLLSTEAPTIQIPNPQPCNPNPPFTKPDPNPQLSCSQLPSNSIFAHKWR